MTALRPLIVCVMMFGGALITIKRYSDEIAVDGAERSNLTLLRVATELEAPIDTRMG